jgi:acyl-CoA thioesterase
MDHPNGGYLQCVIANAAVEAAKQEGARHAHAIAVATNYPGSPVIGDVEISTHVHKVGRAVSFVRVTVAQDGRVTNDSVVTLGTLHPDATIRYAGTQAPSVAPLDRSPRQFDDGDKPFRSAVDIRLDPHQMGWTRGEFSDVAEFSGWLRLVDGSEGWNPWSLLLASDAMPPASFPVGSVGWVPTLQLTSYIRQFPSSEWVSARQWATEISDGLMEERCEIFDERGVLVASSSQIAMVRFGHSS